MSAAAGLLLLASCGGADRQAGNGAAHGNAAGAASATAPLPDAGATLLLADAGPEHCAARWDGQAVTAAQLLDRSAALVERSIHDAGGVDNLTEESLPSVAVQAPAGLGFACADRMLDPVRRAGVPRVLLQPQGTGGALQADFTLSDIGGAGPNVVIALGAGGRLTWNRETVTLDGLTQRARQLGGDGVPGTEAPPGELELRPVREATFGQVHAALAAIREGHMRAALLLPSVPANTRPPATVPIGPPPEANAMTRNAVAP